MLVMTDTTIDVSVVPERSGRSGFAGSVNPELYRLLTALNLDREYVRGDGTVLFDSAGRRYLDFAGAYGALPFGHGPTPIWQAINDVRCSGEPIFVQPSVLTAAGELADRLGRIAPEGLTRTTFVNSGTEATEVALKIARAHTGRLGVLTTGNSFHGKTLGALSATGNIKYQSGFGAPVSGFDHIAFGDAEALEAALAAAPDHYAVFLVEPIQGEGGVVCPPDGYLRQVQEICNRHGVLLALDEVQTGLGRTGRMFAAEHEGVIPDILTLAKALGGGIVPVGAVLCRPELVGESFALRHTSTFAGNALAARVGLAVLEELTRDDRAVVTGAAALGRQLKNDLAGLAEKYPSVVTEVRGRGLLLGIELTADVNFVGRQSLLGSIADQHNLSAVICSYLLNVEGIRVAPTLFGNRVIRIEPPLTVSSSACSRLVAALDRALGYAAEGDMDGLFGHLLGRPTVATPAALTALRPGRTPDIAVRPGDRRFAFIAHPLDLGFFAAFDPALEVFGNAERQDLLERFAASTSELDPASFVIGSGRVSGFGDATAHGDLIGLPYTSQQLLQVPTERALAVVGGAVELAISRGATVVGLGGYSSVITGNGLGLGATSRPITTGNTFTAAASLRAVRRVCLERGIDVARARVTILGAGGAIGRTIGKQLAGEVGSIALVGRRGENSVIAPKLWSAAQEMVASAGSGSGDLAVAAAEVDGDLDDLIRSRDIEFFTDPVAAVRDSLIVIAATSAPQSLIDPTDLMQGAIVCDVAQPPNIGRDVRGERPDVTVFDGGIVRVPSGSDFGLTYGLAPGLTYACMAETMLIALSGEFALRSIGTTLDGENVERLGALADVHGFTLAAATRWRQDAH
ncbi:aminotransferase class III-fold pyridoxal phosphate-dependent enzyme [Rhodococcus fascians]|nr:aminotransferase class III-fold pyridoxal phosphate-dependent enzyme [Rhodococcus fascians]MBY3810020.1 aminotransferase class III-fold pyridoxal phosphate-dependent enzyme [Rhodococcus fascians]MBY3841523.1 aminotransferase class III-fold pyridoxal phosphate-dependent enzyme [Rhodococcus fascians]MBY3844808.1 aminotransferase class III-fold pyridoxal phosphate-dependent enzyme [Rhodococcus fascians]MBY3850729.1 aminotransferase class III-fold pyridoxal phosphate-dependent enzyme [Rhodococcu